MERHLWKSYLNSFISYILNVDGIIFVIDGSEKGLLYKKKIYKLLHNLIGEARHGVLKVLVLVHYCDEHINIIREFLRLDALKTCHWYECASAAVIFISLSLL